jgi:predicted CXXCH cytochrome family protein
VHHKQHLYRVLSVLAVGIVLAFVLQRLMVPKSFGEQGHYRADSLLEIMSREPLHQGREACAECHREVHEAHQKDTHWDVQCEDCHGPGDDHVGYHRDGDAGILPAQAIMPAEYTLEGCLFCHRKLVARPSTFAQIDLLEHYAFLHVTDPTTPCVSCHSPHEPLFLLEGVREARVHPVIFECDDCHDAHPESSDKDVPDHPTIFVCRDCHPSVVKDFSQHEHAFLRCTACHLYHGVNEISGRVFRSGARRFCLLCHERKPFKDPDRLPQIVFEEHIELMAPIMRRLPGPLLEDPTACLQCHFDYIHDSRLIKRLQEQER